MSDEFLQGAASPSASSGEFNALHFFVTRLLGRINTATLVRVISCTNDGGLSPVGTVDVQPIVHQVAATGQLVPQPQVYELPYFRIQGGASAIIIDPTPGDIGIAIFADHDITTMKNTGQAAAPGSFRRFDMADGMYMGGFVNGMPNQYVQFLPDGGGINMVSPTKFTAEAPQIYLIGQVNQSGGTLTAAEDVLVGPSSLSVVNHDHGGVQTGTGTTGVMQN